MVNEKYPCFCRTKSLNEASPAPALVLHTDKLSGRVQHVQIADRKPAAHKIRKIVQVGYAGPRPPESDVIKLVGPDAGEVQTSSNRQGRKPPVVLYPAQPFFRDGKQYLPVTRDARRRVVRLRIVDSQTHHLSFCPRHQRAPSC